MEICFSSAEGAADRRVTLANRMAKALLVFVVVGGTLVLSSQFSVLTKVGAY